MGTLALAGEHRYGRDTQHPLRRSYLLGRGVHSLVDRCGTNNDPVGAFKITKYTADKGHLILDKQSHKSPNTQLPVFRH